MNTTLPKAIAFSLAWVAIIVLTYRNADNPWTVLLVGLLVNILSAPLSFYVIDLLNNCRRLSLLFRTKVILRNQHVRLSFAYLIRIKVNGKYLLVKNRKRNSYQLVGGVYKRYMSSETLLSKYNIRSDRQFETDHGIAKNDLRINVPGKYVLNIMNWFASRQDREISQWREFCEELLSTDILDKRIFRYIDYKYVATLQTPLQKAKHIDCQEILIHEIYDLIPNEEQEKALLELLSDGDNDQVKWAEEWLINSLGFNEQNKEQKFEIGAHTKWAINLRYSD